MGLLFVLVAGGSRHGHPVNCDCVWYGDGYNRTSGTCITANCSEPGKLNG